MPKGKKTKQKKNHAGEIGGIIFIAVGIFIGVCVFMQTNTGMLGGVIKNILFGLLGLFAYLAPFAFVILGILMIASRNKKVNKAKVGLSILFVVSLLSLVQTFLLTKLDLESGFFSYVADSYRVGMEFGAGSGAVGCLLVYPFNLLIGDIGCVILFITACMISVLILLNLSVKKMGQDVARVGRRTVEIAKETVAERKKHRLYIEDLRDDYPEVDDCDEPEILNKKSFRKKNRVNYFEEDMYDPDEVQEKAEKLVVEDASGAVNAEPAGLTFESYESYDQNNHEKTKAEDSTKMHVVKNDSQKEYVFPPTSLLSKPAEKSKGAGMEEQRRNALLIEETLANFGVEAKVVHIVKGPAVTRYELRPAPGVRVKRIKELENDLAMNLAAKAVKIEAPIPGKAAVGVEVPNSDVTFVHLRTLLECDEFRKAKSPLTFALGKDISGKNYYVDITKMPHILIAGETGSGKSVCINALLTSILYKSTPDDVKMILIDPKVVELSVFKNIPHLLVPVVTDTKKAAGALHWAVSEMTTRYKTFAEYNVRNITRYNETVAKNEGEQKLPRLIVVIDELAELMMAAPREVEDAICRIAQLGRAAGIHLVVATQRPSVNVITGVIKANISSRIAFKVNSGVDSRTILDQHGAEKLLRNGDMLYHPSDAPKTVRLQGCFVSDSDIESVTDYISDGSDAEFDEEVVSDMTSGAKDEEQGDEDYDELLPRAVEIVLEYGQASISMLQRRLRVGYARAARLVDEMEVRQIVSPFEGSKARQVLISWDHYEDMFGPREV